MPFNGKSLAVTRSTKCLMKDDRTLTIIPLNPGLDAGAVCTASAAKASARAIPDQLWAEIFDSLQHDRDRAIICLLVSSGSRAQELLTMRGEDVDWGRQRVRLVCKGTRAESWVAASPEFFRWLAAYLTKRSRLLADSPLWVTLRRPERRLGYTALRAIITRVNEKLGTNVTAHDFRHTCALRLASDTNISLGIFKHTLGTTLPTTESILLRSRRSNQRLQLTNRPIRAEAATPFWDYNLRPRLALGTEDVNDPWATVLTDTEPLRNLTSCILSLPVRGT